MRRLAGFLVAYVVVKSTAGYTINGFPCGEKYECEQMAIDLNDTVDRREQREGYCRRFAESLSKETGCDFTAKWKDEEPNGK